MRTLYVLLAAALGAGACAPRATSTQSAAQATAAFQSSVSTAVAASQAVTLEPTATLLVVTASPLLSPTPAPRPTVRAVAPPPPGSIAIEYGEKEGYLARQGTQTYTFLGAEGDLAAVRVELSIAHRNLPYCSRAASTTLAFRSDAGTEIQPAASGASGSQKIYRLPYTGRYSFYVACRGAPCDGVCMQVDVTLEKQ